MFKANEQKNLSAFSFVTYARGKKRKSLFLHKIFPLSKSVLYYNHKVWAIENRYNAERRKIGATSFYTPDNVVKKSPVSSFSGP
jgi:hypothetical protein